MVVTSEKQNELFGKLVVIARGDLELVKRAILLSAKEKDSADLAEVIAYIKAHRAPEPELADAI